MTPQGEVKTQPTSVSSTIRHFYLKYHNVKKQTVCDFINAYESPLKIDPTVEIFFGKKDVRPFVLPQEFMNKTIATVMILHLKGAHIGLY